MSIKILTIISVIIFALVGCGTEEGKQDNTENMNSQPINYETKEEQKERTGNKEPNLGEKGGYPQSEQTEMNDGDASGQSDLYTNQTSILISKKLKERREVIQAQVAVTDDKAIVGVIISPSSPPNMRKILKQEVHEMVPNREVEVYTDDIYWDRMRNKDAKLDQLNGDMNEFLNEFFNTTRD
ncbi:Sporulation lipoprotein YhcN/YlaJ (Spore_YhcN_YlaJ) [Virgibacillus subterraneus]|uniref:Sporulation lipoprotein YhcN/YlaJ (Spore_YhcN_YlaJ) n=2 Tax=Virgibacillus TaxID=84406 RepID=A0A1H1B5H2_9BACI|nr:MULTISPECIES: YhcN/YlaJ family sporulation lipoprotein [Virgibacillus]SDQ46656.1 Sporulation lipoprotein YhcN/YlaJ (Spore_YhcN_YlaJ) [Virgibacillus salinus]SEQ15082.1 Sporulation lipoprotein YhcN/YlaJ (Spore_YhcN_YlaJ) [Virgibacillus subterraneus]